MDKLQVLLAAVAAVGAVLLLGDRLLPVGPGEPVLLVVSAAPALLGAAGLTLGLALAVGLLTLWARPAGAIGAMLLGLGALSLLSPPLRNTLWYRPGPLEQVFPAMALELLLWAGLVLLGQVVLLAVRVGVWRLRPGWFALPTDARPAGWAGSLAGVVAAESPAEAPRVAGGLTNFWAIAGGALLVGLGVATVLLQGLLQSPDRGQIVFAVLVSFYLGGLVAHQVFPTRLIPVAWLMPLGVGSVFYVLAAIAPLGQGPIAWVRVSLLARVLPVDYLALGGAAAVMGFWTSQRLAIARRLAADQNPEGARQP